MKLTKCPSTDILAIPSRVLIRLNNQGWRMSAHQMLFSSTSDIMTKTFGPHRRGPKLQIRSTAPWSSGCRLWSNISDSFDFKFSTLIKADSDKVPALPELLFSLSFCRSSSLMRSRLVSRSLVASAGSGKADISMLHCLFGVWSWISVCSCRGNEGLNFQYNYSNKFRLKPEILVHLLGFKSLLSRKI